MDTERESGDVLRDVRFLMRMLTNLNAGAMLALCLWLAWAALDYNARHLPAQGAITVSGCGCVLNEMDGESGPVKFVARDR